MKEQFTQGDWHCKEFNNLTDSVQYVRNDKIEICILFNGVEVNAANAHLIAAAPKMYRMLADISKSIDHCGDEVDVDFMKDSIDKLMAEARGENNER